jgi:hypothetical protein
MREGLSTWYQNRDPGSIPLGHTFSIALINSTLTSKKSKHYGSTEYAYGSSTWSRLTRIRENIGLRIKVSLSSSISPKFYSRTDRGVKLLNAR